MEEEEKEESGNGEGLSEGKVMVREMWQKRRISFLFRIDLQKVKLLS